MHWVIFCHVINMVDEAESARLDPYIVLVLASVYSRAYVIEYDKH